MHAMNSTFIDSAKKQFVKQLLFDFAISISPAANQQVVIFAVQQKMALASSFSFILYRCVHKNMEDAICKVINH